MGSGRIRVAMRTKRDIHDPDTAHGTTLVALAQTFEAWFCPICETEFNSSKEAEHGCVSDFWDAAEAVSLAKEL